MMAIVRVLLVDDVKLFLEFERTFFERTGCQILTASSGEEAIALARSERPHIILLDYEMPGKKGDEVCRALKADERTKHIPILVVTTFGGDEVKERCLAAGAAGFLAKPVSGRELLERVVDILQIPYRVFMRTPLSMEISLLSAGIRRKAQGYSEDLSETGMLAELTEYIARGSVVSVEFSLPGAEGPVRVEAEVVRTFEKRARGRFGIGLRFTQVSGIARRRIREFVKAATT
jgi:CheY-like chemotaxis protein